jgi:hypothetical protein
VSFATTGLLAAQAGIELGTRDLDLSEADQHFCSSHGANCGGWNNGDALGQVQSRGISAEFDFPYDNAFDNPPQWDPNDPNVYVAHSRPEPFRNVNAYKIANYHAWTGDDRKSYLATVGPLVCGFTVYQDFDHYGNGVYHHVWGNVRGGHAVLVVGYSDVDQAWICRNSWGTAYWSGPANADGTGAGFFKIGYGECGIDGEPMFGCSGVIPPVQRLRLGLAALNNRLYAGWKGEHGDDRVFNSSSDGTSWVPQQQIGGIGSSSGPSFATYNGRVYAAWKGAGSDQGIYWSSTDGTGWAAQQHISGVGTSVGPSLAIFDSKLYAAWKGVDNDQGIYWSSFDGHTWAPQQHVSGVGTSTGPALATYGAKLYAAWKGMNNDQAIWWSSFDGHAWAPQQAIGGVATSVGPTLAVFQDKLYAAWKGMGNDQGIYWSSFSGHPIVLHEKAVAAEQLPVAVHAAIAAGESPALAPAGLAMATTAVRAGVLPVLNPSLFLVYSWAPQQRMNGVATSVGPTIASFGNKLYAMWKGMSDDQRLWWSSFDGTTWSPQATAPGNTCPD